MLKGIEQDAEARDSNEGGKARKVEFRVLIGPATRQVFKPLHGPRLACWIAFPQDKNDTHGDAEPDGWRAKGKGDLGTPGPEEAGASRSGGEANERADDLAAESHRVAGGEAITCQPRDFDLNTLGDRTRE